jgi:hypothetical protein
MGTLCVKCISSNFLNCGFVVSYQRDNNDMETLENMKLELAQSKEMLDERERKINKLQGKLNEEVKENKKS